MRIAVAENFNGTLKVEAFLNKKENTISVVCSNNKEVLSTSILPLVFIEQIKECVTDVHEMKGRYRAV